MTSSGRKIHQYIFKIHSWLGLANGIWLLILGITGSLYVYAKELDEWINKDLLKATPAETRLPYDSLYKIVRNQYPGAMGTNIMRFHQHKDESVQFRVYVEDGTQPMARWSKMYFVDIDPYSGKILRNGDHDQLSDSFLFWMEKLHWSLNFGPIGVLIITLAGVLVFLNIITGVIIYRKYFLPAMIFRAPLQWKNWRTISSGLHRYIGVWSLVLNLLIFYSGLQMTWNIFSKDSWQPPVAMTPVQGSLASVDKMMEETARIFPGFEMKYFYIPFRSGIINGNDYGIATAMGRIPGTPYIIPLSRSSVSFNIHTGEVVEKKNANEEIAKMNWWDQFNYVAYSFHAGTFAGEFSRILYVVVGLLPSILAFTGFLLWWRRQKFYSRNNLPLADTKSNIKTQKHASV